MNDRVGAREDGTTGGRPDYDLDAAEAGDLLDELPLWSAPFGLALLDAVPMRPGQLVLDVGAGTGFPALELAERLGASSRVLAVDPWGPGVARLRRKALARGLSNVEVFEGDVVALDVPDASVDLVVSNLGLNNFDDPVAVLRRCARALKPGGRLVLTTNPTGHMAELYDVFRETLVAAGQRGRLEALEAHVAHRGTLESVAALVTDAGLEVARVTTGRFRMRFADGGALLSHTLIRIGFLPAWREVPAPGSEQVLLSALERSLDAVAARDGEVALTVPWVCVDAVRRRDG